MPATFFNIPGRPVPKGRPRFSRGHAYTPKATLEYEKHVAECAVFPEGWPLDAEYSATLLVHYNTNVTADMDNIAKSVFDGLNNHGGAWLDDKQIAYFQVRRVWSASSYVEVWIDAAPRTYPDCGPPKKQARKKKAVAIGAQTKYSLNNKTKRKPRPRTIKSRSKP